MSNEVQNPDTADQMSDTPMESPEKGKGKIPIVAHHPMEHDAMDDDDSSEEDEEVSFNPERGANTQCSVSNHPVTGRR